jgi:hypothetical protein
MEGGEEGGRGSRVGCEMEATVQTFLSVCCAVRHAIDSDGCQRVTLGADQHQGRDMIELQRYEMWGFGVEGMVFVELLKILRENGTGAAWGQAKERV